MTDTKKRIGVLDVLVVVFACGVWFSIAGSVWFSFEAEKNAAALAARTQRGELAATFKGTKQEKEAAVSKACGEILDDWRAVFVQANRVSAQRSCEGEVLMALYFADRKAEARRLTKEMNLTEDEAWAVLDEMETRVRAAALADKEKADEKLKARAKALADRIEAGQGGKSAGSGAK